MTVPQIGLTLAKTFKAKVLATAGLIPRLPPGFLNPFDRTMFRDQHVLLKKAARYGPVFKTIWSRQLLVCVVGNDLGQRFLKTHQRNLQGVSIDLKKYFAAGILRNMKGQAHRDCKQHLVRLLDPQILIDRKGDLSDYVRSQLVSYAESDAISGADLKAMLYRLVTGCMVMLFFGVKQSSHEFNSLVESYFKFGPNDLVWKLSSAQDEAYAELLAQAGLLLEECKTSNERRGYLQSAFHIGSVSEAVLGNLIYMVEMGRHDVVGLARWVLKYLGENQYFTGEIRELLNSSKNEAASAFIEHAIHETLRLNQSAALLRKTTCAIEFEGMHIPAGTYVRICLWEAHKDANNFEDPFSFKPARFHAAMPTADKFAPFGLDGHRCLGPDIVYGIVSIFLTELISKFDFKTIADGPVFLAQTIWEPSPQFAVQLRN